jgi:hypothetical protein
MSTETAKESPPEYATVRLPKEIVRQLGIIAQHQDKSIGEILAGWVRTRAEREYRETVRKMSAELGEAGA